MTLTEFKAWFEGYTEGLESAPTKAQFERIKEKVKEISGTPITYPVYIDRYVQPTTYATGGAQYGTAGYATGGSNNLGATAFEASVHARAEGFNSVNAMYALGKAEAAVN